MPNDTLIEQRMAALEAAVAELQRRLSVSPPAPCWLDQVIGTLKDEPAFEEVLQYGRAWRAADRPKEDAGP